MNLSGRKLTVEEEKDVDQARKGIEASRSLLPLLPQEAAKPIQDALSQLQILYVRETKGPEQQQEPPKPDIWTPGS